MSSSGPLVCHIGYDIDHSPDWSCSKAFHHVKLKCSTSACRVAYTCTISPIEQCRYVGKDLHKSLKFNLNQPGRIRGVYASAFACTSQPVPVLMTLSFLNIITAAESNFWDLSSHSISNATTLQPCFIGSVTFQAIGSTVSAFFTGPSSSVDFWGLPAHQRWY